MIRVAQKDNKIFQKVIVTRMITHLYSVRPITFQKVMMTIQNQALYLSKSTEIISPHKTLEETITNL